MQKAEGLYSWEEIGRKLDQTAAAIDKAWNPDAEQSGAILRERASRLASQEFAAGQQDLVEILITTIGKEQYGFELSMVAEVEPVRELTPIPSTPPWIAGIAAIRSRIVTIVDPGRLFGMERRENDQVSTVVVLRSDNLEIGVIVDQVIGVTGMSLNQLQTTMHIPSPFPEDFILGISSEPRAIVFDIRKFVSSNMVDMK